MTIGWFKPRRAAPQSSTSEDFLGPGDIDRIVAHYAERPQAPVSYGTVRDYCDSIDVIGSMARYNRDMKDLQRCWTLKAILAHVPRGGRLLEVGAGQPLVADVLARAGYDVTVVDPYQGHGDGPVDAGHFRRTFTRLKIRAELFHDRLEGLEPGSFDCCYSISVLEHLTEEALASVTAGIRRYAKPDVVSVHSVDHVLLGIGADFHHRLLHSVGASFGQAPDALDALLAAASCDPETYFLSAEGHDGWRAGQSYDAFPMRRCISVQICSGIAP